MIPGMHSEIIIYFAYRDGEYDELEQQHRETFEQHADFETSSVFVETN